MPLPHHAKPAFRGPLRTLARLRPVALASLLVGAGLAPAADYGWYSSSFSTTGLPSAITINDTLAIACPPGLCGGKTLDQSFLNNGQIFASDSIYFQYTSQVLTNGWQYQLQGDVGLINAYAGGSFVNESSGSLVKTAGTGTSLISISSLHKGGSIVDATSGRLEFNGADTTFESGAHLVANAGTTIAFTGGTLSLSNGSLLHGSGEYVIGTNATVTGTLGATQLAFTGGTYTGSSATLTSNATWAAGVFAGDWTVQAGRTLTATDVGAHYLRGSIANAGSLDAAANLYFEYPSYSINNTGTLRLNGDVGLVNIYAGGTLVTSGTLTKASGVGTSLIQGISVTSNGSIIDAQSGVLQFSGGALAFNDGTRFTGAGQVLVAGNASFAGRIDSENLVLLGASYDGAAATLHGRTTLGSAALTGQWTFAADHVLTQTDAVYVRGTVSNAGRHDASAHLYFEYPGYVLNNSGQMNLLGNASLVNIYAGGTFISSGTLAKPSGAGGSLIQGLSSSISGLVRLDGGTLTFSGGTLALAGTATVQLAAGTSLVLGGSTDIASGASFIGPGSVEIASNATVSGPLGASQLSFTNGTFTGNGATLTSNATWAAGAFAGDWTVAPGATLTVTDAGAHYVRGTLSNQGTLDVAANLYFEYPSYSIQNTGMLRLNGDVNLVNAYAGGTLVNSGTVSKTAGTAASAFLGINVTSQGGRFDAQTGVLYFGSGSYAAFNDGTRFTGAGQVLVNSPAGFAGRIDSENLMLSGASFNGAAATLHGRTRMESAALTGQWTLAPDHELTLSGSNYIRGSVLNQGRLDVTGNVYFEYPSYVLNNSGQMTLQGDVGLFNVYAGGTFVNSGTLAKTSGAGISNLAGLSVTNTGTLDVQVGTLALPDNFVNDGTLKGNGSFSTSTLTNNGHIAPGASPGTLTQAGHLVLGESGSLDLELGSASSHDLLQVLGNVTLGGTLSLSCWADCHFAAGTDLRVLDATGSLTGTFSQVVVAGFAPGAFEVRIDAANADVWLHATQDITAAVPEPSTYALLFSGLGLLAWRARRRA